MSAEVITKKKFKKKKLKASQQKYKLFRATDPRMAVLMWGVHHSISQLSHIAPRVMLLDDDFKAYGKIRIDNHLYNKENMPAHFKFKEYMPLVFQNLRRRFNVDEKSFARSFFVQPQSKPQTGNSGSKFFLTENKLYLVKTIGSEEVETMHDMMPLYYQHIVESHPDTILPQYLGMYRTTVDAKEIYYLVLRNILSTVKKIHKKYDLKGSRVDRDAKDADKEQEEPTLKDNDFTKDNAKIYIGPDTTSIMIEKINKAADFLASLHIMDYSLLVGVHDCEGVSDHEGENGVVNDVDTGEESGDGLEDLSNAIKDFHLKSYPDINVPTNENPDPEFFAVHSNHETKKEVYYMGIIDVLSVYGTQKKAAHAAKKVKHGVGAEISTVNPQLYATRFKEFMATIFE